MDEITKDLTNEVQYEMMPDENEPESTDDALRDAIEDQLKKIQRQNMLIGAQTMCRVILDKIIAAEVKPGKRTMNDYKRLIKDIRGFCETGLSRKVNADGETEAIEEEPEILITTQN